MADEEVQDQSLALNTDLPPDRIGQAAFRNQNLLPNSPITVVPRGGESLVGHYSLDAEGRAIWTDDAPGRSDNAILIIATRRDSGGVQTVEGVHLHLQHPSEFGVVEIDPTDIGGTDWSSGGDESRESFIYGWIVVAAAAGAPPDPLYGSKFNFVKSTPAVTTFTEDFGDGGDDTPVASAVVPIRNVGTTLHQFGMLALMLFRENGANTDVVIGFYSLTDDTRVEDDTPAEKELTTTVSSILPPALLNKIGVAGVAPLQAGFRALLWWYPTADADPPNCTIAAWVRASVDTTGGNRRTVEDILELATTEWIMDICPFSKQSEMYFLVAKGKTADSVQATGALTFVSNPADGETLTVNGVQVTFLDSPSDDNHVQRHASDQDVTMANLVTTLGTTLSANASLNVAMYESDAPNNKVDITYIEGGTGGNAFTLADSSAGAITRSAATLEGGVDAESHLMQYKLTLKETGWPEDPTDDDLITAFTDQWAGGKELTHSGWVSRPDTVLKVQPTPAIDGLEQWIVMLAGDLYTDAIIPGNYGVTDPRLVLMTFPGVATWTHTTFFGKAWGMVVTETGEIYVTATKEIMAGKPYLICRYDATRDDFGELQAWVEHFDNGLGSHTEDPEETRVLEPIWENGRLTVQDHRTTSTWAYVYDRDLNFINKYEIATEDPADGKRWRVSKYSSPWFSRNY